MITLSFSRLSYLQSLLFHQSHPLKWNQFTIPAECQYTLLSITNSGRHEPPIRMVTSAEQTSALGNTSEFFGNIAAVRKRSHQTVEQVMFLHYGVRHPPQHTHTQEIISVPYLQIIISYWCISYHCSAGRNACSVVSVHNIPTYMWRCCHDVIVLFKSYWTYGLHGNKCSLMECMSLQNVTAEFFQADCVW